MESRDVTAAAALLSDDVVFRSPIVFTPYRGRDAVSAILRAVVDVFDDFRYVRETSSPDGVDRVLVFQARVAELRIEGCDILRRGTDGLVDELTVMVRPLTAAQALAGSMTVRLTGDPAS